MATSICAERTPSPVTNEIINNTDDESEKTPGKEDEDLPEKKTFNAPIADDEDEEDDEA